jgi:hypothetical protein
MMATLTVSEVRNRAKATTVYKSAQTLLSESVRAQAQSPRAGGYDIFLSHSFQDADLVLGLKLKLEQDFGHSVYVDWLADPQLDRSKVNAETAKTLRARMNRCKGLLYAATVSSTDSKWMPWECGYFDGKFGKAAIVPLTDSPVSDYKGQEYLGVYPYVVEDNMTVQGRTQKVLWVQSSPKVYCTLSSWLNGSQPTAHA